MPEDLVLRPYQQRMIDHAHRTPYCAIWADMGSGKTATVLSLILRLAQEADVVRVLAVAPKRVALGIWSGEITRWRALQGASCRILTSEDFRYARKEEIVRRRGSETRVKRLVPQAAPESFLTGELITTVSRDHLASLVRVLGRRWPYDMLVLDESSGFRNPSAERVKAVKALRKAGLIGRLIQLSGTPRPKSLMDLWSQIYLLDGGERLGRTITAYRDKYFLPDKRSRDGQIFTWRPKPGAEEDIFDRLKDICVSLLPEDIIQLPERTINKIPVTLPERARTKYREIEREALTNISGADVVALSRAALVGKLLQMAGGAVYDEHGNVQHLHDAKLDALEELVESNAGTPLLIAYWYKHELARIKARFTQAVEYDDYPDTDKRWNNGEIDMLLLHPASGGHGLNLQFNDGRAVWYGPIHDLELWQQWNKRMWRPGRKYPVFIHVLLACDTIDNAVFDALGPKGDGQDRLLRAVQLRLGEISDG